MEELETEARETLWFFQGAVLSPCGLLEHYRMFYTVECCEIPTWCLEKLTHTDSSLSTSSGGASGLGKPGLPSTYLTYLHT